ncbi:hypothetical protein BUE80_DR004656 [Diplocarpon rosae]|nr:hypothetical protein BUE80_DR004656 [Diplocarpon rosae]
MASYKSGLGPPTRPGDISRGRRLGAYMQAGSVKPPEKELREDIAHTSGQGPRRRATPVTEAPQTRLPRPSSRYASPNARPRPEKLKVTTATHVGFGSSSVRAPAEKVQPELKGKLPWNVLRKKPSSVAQILGHAIPSAERTASSSPAQSSQSAVENRPSVDPSIRLVEGYKEIFTRQRAAVRELPPIIPELDRYRNRPEVSRPHGKSVVDLPPKLSTQDLPSPIVMPPGTPVYSSAGSIHHRYSGAHSGTGYSASPSTRFSESPGPGMYSRDTTPTSVSSHSPGIIAPCKTATPRLRKGIPALSRPPLSSARMRAASISNEVEAAPLQYHGLSSLQKSATSSSSNSSAKGEGKTEAKEKGKRPALPPPSLPPRKSSQKFKSSRPEEQHSPRKSYGAPAEPVATAEEPLPIKKQSTSTPASKENGLLTRPSREGTPDLQSQLGNSMTFFRSNSAGISLSPDSALPRSAAPSPQPHHLTPQSQRPSSLPSRNPCRSSILGKATPAHSGLGILPDLPPQQPSKATATRTPNRCLSNNKSQFSLFGRRTKTAPDLPTTNSKDKTPRKGPVAGTGHEGYCRYGLRARSISVASSSQESVASTRDHDLFLVQRMSPVIIAGGGEVVKNRNASFELSHSESNTSLVGGRPSMESRGSSNLSHERLIATLGPSAFPREPSKRSLGIAMPKSRRASDSSGDRICKSSITFRPSVQPMNSSTSTLNLPAPLNLSPTGHGASASVTILDANFIAISTDSQEPKPVNIQAPKLEINRPKKSEKRPHSLRKWNIFHRSHPTKPEPEIRTLRVNVAKSAPTMPAVPHYAMLDSSDEQLDLEDGAMDLDGILRDADVNSLSNKELDLLQCGNLQGDQRCEKNTHTSRPVLSKITPVTLFSSPEPVATHASELTGPRMDLHLTNDKDTAPMRPSRLPQVGRIPKVVSARPETTSPKSFSRPFARLSTIQPLTSLQTVDKDSVGLGYIPPISLTPEPYSHSRHPQAGSEGAPSASVDAGVEEESGHRGFLSFSPRKNSQATTTSTCSSCGSGSVSITAVIPEANAELGEDEVWNEYDDLIQGNGNEKVPQPVSARSLDRTPFQYEGFEMQRVKQNSLVAKESPTLASVPKLSGLTPELGMSERCSALTTSSVYSADMGARLREALDTISTPTTPMSFPVFLEGYGEGNNSVLKSLSQKLPRRASQISLTSRNKPPSSSSHSRSTSGPGSGAGAITGQMVENEGEGILGQKRGSGSSGTNLRAASITVSRWLTFGHVVFSPVQEEIEMRGGEAEVLVVDGLGNDDWSFYASETYPSATFTNLSPTASSSSQSRSPLLNFPHAPPNHLQIQHPSLSSPLFADTQFPFPFSTFNAVILRFPPASPLANTTHLVSEAFRVLKPGGYLELAVLDLDMLNMGNRIRRAVRGLKVHIRTLCPQVSLGSASDTILKIAGSCGFGDIKSCKVGVPVAGAISAASDGSSSSSSPKTDKGRSRKGTSTSVDAKRLEGKRKGKRKYLAREREEPSFASLVRSSPTPSADEGITQMVARVGRWWYINCYESSLQSTSPSAFAASSIFDDDSVLRECEAWGTSFKLLVAHARKPAVLVGKRPVAGRGRGVSV